MRRKAEAKWGEAAVHNAPVNCLMPCKRAGLKSMKSGLELTYRQSRPDKPSQSAAVRMALLSVSFLESPFPLATLGVPLRRSQSSPTTPHTRTAYPLRAQLPHVPFSSTLLVHCCCATPVKLAVVIRNTFFVRPFFPSQFCLRHCATDFLKTFLHSCQKS